MKYLFVICMFFSACNILKKSVKKSKQIVATETKMKKDSIGRTIIDSTKVTGMIRRGSTTIDSDYDKVTEEVIEEVIDSQVIHRQITRTVKEKGQKKVEKTSTTIKMDSSGKTINQISDLKLVEIHDSTGTLIVTNKNIKRSSLLSWWVWLIVLAVIIVTWLKRNSIINFFS